MIDPDNPDRDQATGSDPEMEVMRSDPRQLRMMKQWAATTVVAIVLLWLLVKHWLNLGDADVVMHRMKLMCYFLSVLLFAIAGYVGWYARRIFRASQYPPPDGWVLGDTRVLRGQDARVRGWCVLAIAIVFALLAIYAAILPHSVDAMLMPPPQVIQLGPPHG